MFQLDLKSRKSIYEQVVDNLKELIILGVLKNEDKLPSVRDLSKTLTVNPNTIQKAYRELEHQGYVYTVAGLGTFVAERKNVPIDTHRLAGLRQTIGNAIKELLYIGLSYEEAKKEVLALLEERSHWK